MKTKIKTAACVTVMLAFAACNKEDVPAVGTDDLQQQVKITVTIDGQQQTRATFNPDGSGNFEDGDKFILRYNTDGTSIYNDLTYTVGQTLKWSDISDGSKVNFTAWYPDTIAVVRDKVSGYNYIAGNVDVLLAMRVSAVPGETVNLQFRHIMHRLQVNLTSEIHTAEQLAAATVTLKEAVETHARIDVNTGIVGANTSKTLTDYPAPYPVGRGANPVFIVAPQVFTAGVPMLSIAVDGKTYTFNVPSTITTLHSGQTLTLNLKISAAAVQLGSTSFAAWTVQGAYDGNPKED